MKRTKILLLSFVAALIFLLVSCSTPVTEDSTTQKGEEATDTDISEDSDPPVHTHALIEVKRTEPTCMTEGNILYFRCTACGQAYLDASGTTEACSVALQKLLHDTESIPGKEPTCTEKGHHAYIACKNCSFSTYQEIEALGHDKVSHGGEEATCTKSGFAAYETCTRCRYSTYREIPKAEHTLDEVPAKAASCTEVGWNAYFTCRFCDYHTKAELPKIEHIYGRDMYCDGCGKEKEATVGLVFTQSADGSYYTLSFVGEDPPEEVVVPSHYLGLPVKQMAAGAFERRGDTPFDTQIKRILLPNSMEMLPDYAFCSCLGLEEIYIPESIMEIGEGIFSYTASLMSVTVAEGNPIYSSYSNCIIDKESKSIVAGGGQVSIPDDGSVTRIAPYAFSGVKNLIRLVIPASVTEIGENAFLGCDRLQAVCNLSALPLEKGSTAHGGVATGARHLCQNAACADCLVDENGFVIYTEGSEKILFGCYQMHSVCQVPEGVTAIGKNAFAYDAVLCEILLPSSVKQIEEQAFMHCRSLRKLRLATEINLDKIGALAFAACEDLTEIDYPDTAACWSAIEKKFGWDIMTGSYTVICSDGNLKKQ